jgi:radical SAM superfamily enzyme YgiQ (UPF0313 family)
MRILLVQPAPFENGRLGLENALWMGEPAALTSIAAMVTDEHDVRILDMRLEEADALPLALWEFRPELVGVTAMTTDIFQAHAVLHCAKAILGQNVFTLIGGHHPTLVPEESDIDCVDAVCIGEGEETLLELVGHLSAGGSPTELDHIDGVRFRRGGERAAQRATTHKRSQARGLDDFPTPARELIADYRPHYFFGPAGQMASIQTSRGCAFDCNFCAIWEFYERKVRFLSPEKIVDRMEATTERFILFLDDNFLTNPGRVDALLDEIERRGVKKYWMIQGRTDFIAQNPERMRRMADAGLAMVLSGYETNDAGTLDALKKDNTRENNLKAASILQDLGIFTTGIFMARPDFQEADFEELFEAINEMRITIPLVVLHTPLPGTQSWRASKHELLTNDARLFDLLHAVTPTAAPRNEFYRMYARWNQATMPSTRASLSLRFLARRPRLVWTLLKGWSRFKKRLLILRQSVEDPQSYLRDELGIIPAQTETSELVPHAAEREPVSPSLVIGRSA